MRNFLLGMLLAVVIVLGITHYISHKNEHKTVLESSDLILDQVQNVGKLIVTEGHFSEVITYKDARKIYLDMFTAKKRAIVVVNAEVTIAYDLSKIHHVLDSQTKTLTITNIPKADIKISPTLKYHDLEDDLLNPFTPEDHNRIQEQVQKQLRNKIQNSNLASNAENRLLSELQKIYILTNSLGWNLVYNGNTVSAPEDLKL